MKNNLKFLFIGILLISVFGTLNVKAYSKSKFNSKLNFETKEEYHLFENCDAVLGTSTDEGAPAYYLQMILNVIKYAGIILCIVLTAKDFALCIMSGEKDGFKPALQKGLKRLAFACALFFLPIIVDTIMKLIGMYNGATCGIQ